MGGDNPVAIGVAKHLPSTPGNPRLIVRPLDRNTECSSLDLNPLPRFIRRGAAIGSWSTARRCGDGHECRRELAVAARFDPSEKLAVWHDPFPKFLSNNLDVLGIGP
jgi:hypothetical protein